MSALPPPIPVPEEWGHATEMPGVDRYAVRWQKDGRLHVRYFILADDAEAMLAYVKQIATDAYAVSVA